MVKRRYFLKIFLSKFQIRQNAPIRIKWLRIYKQRIRETDSGGKINGIRGIKRIFYIFLGMI